MHPSSILSRIHIYQRDAVELLLAYYLSLYYMLNKQHFISAGAGALLVASVGAGALTFAQTSTTTPTVPPIQKAHMPGVGGTVSAVSGNTITLTGKNGTTYTIDAGAATITKDLTVTVGDVKVGDTIVADGTVSGTSVAATIIHDGKLAMGGMMGHRGHGGKMPQWIKKPATTSTSTSTQ